MKKLRNGMRYAKVGETFTLENGTELQCCTAVVGCGGCYFSDGWAHNHSKRCKDGCTLMGCGGYACFANRRPDDIHVIFVRV